MAIDAAMGAPRPNMNDSISKVLQSLTLEEKCTLLSGKNMWETADIPRLGTRSLKTSDGPAGVRGSRWTDGTHTTYIPCGISLAATFDPGLIQRVGKILGAEAKTKGATRSPFGGRNFENFGEDPYLTGVMASSYIMGVQSEGVGACMKHYVANDMETRRFNMDEQIDERTLREIYLKPFEMALEADPWTAMTAYPKINGEHADTSRFLVYDILRQEWGYDGLVMSDWGGLNSTVDSIHATTDLEMPGPPLCYGKALLKAVESGAVSEEEHVNSEAASQGIVLLKNTGILPLRPSKLRSLAIIGPNAKTPTTGGTGSAIVNPYYITTPFDSISDAAKSANPDIQITHHRGVFTHLQPPLIGDCLTNPTTGAPGLRVDFYSGNTFSGNIISSSDWHNSLVYFMSDGDVPPSLRGTIYTYKATGLLRPSATGTYDFSLSNTGKAKLSIDDELLIDNSDWTQISGNFMNCGSVELVAAVAAVNRNVVVVTQSACAVAMPWVDGPAAIVHVWYQGQECGNAIADVIFGKVNPSGKLPLTFPKRIEDHGSHKWFPGDAENDYAEYGEGVLVGYRWFDEQGTEPLWPFGYGLSYTKFQITDIAVKGTISAAGDRSASIAATATNVGDISSSEVLQVYVSSSPAIKELGRPSAPKSLAGFQKVVLRPGESKSLAIHLDAKAVAWFDIVGTGGPGSGGKWRVDRGIYKCFVGS
ncbi:Exo-alpha-(1-_6)-L-arabinopyranosidase [Colletotrichum viniferum]|nr:Exo-alpha-(1->6)-L-arabinopyranosidase [Colletotrichum viniferum]